MITVTMTVICITFSEINLPFLGKLEWQVKRSAAMRTEITR